MYPTLKRYEETVTCFDFGIISLLTLHEIMIEKTFDDPKYEIKTLIQLRKLLTHWGYNYTKKWVKVLWS
ncbi:hypothetical protein MHB44_14620 [Lysinibacillus sp. FSL H8-0500]|uniref:hypothetical protein n=1 Tax=Lysinibacillus sp. FSL H8-0500 TaxID=2921393 RepID=UPI0031015776